MKTKIKKLAINSRSLLHQRQQRQSQAQIVIKIHTRNRLKAMKQLKDQVRPSIGLGSFHVFNIGFTEFMDTKTQIAYLNHLINRKLFYFIEKED